MGAIGMRRAYKKKYHGLGGGGHDEGSADLEPGRKDASAGPTSSVEPGTEVAIFCVAARTACAPT